MQSSEKSQLIRRKKELENRMNYLRRSMNQAMQREEDDKKLTFETLKILDIDHDLFMLKRELNGLGPFAIGKKRKITARMEALQKEKKKLEDKLDLPVRNLQKELDELLAPYQAELDEIEKQLGQ